MVFSSLTFLLFFFPVIGLLYFWVRNDRMRNGILLIASIGFYAFGEPKWVFVMLAMVLVNYLCALSISTAKNRKARTLFLIVGVVFSLGFLFYFKYASFFCNEVLRLVHSTARVKDIVLPVGISFYTYQILTYIVDVYREKIPVQTNFFRLLLYVSFFPQLIAGPIVNYKDISDSLAHRKENESDYYDGFLRFIVGLSKKCLLANTCGEVVSELTTAGNSVAGAWLLAMCYSLQLYFDFSGYSDMAIGLGRMFGFSFKENFLHPYTADSITDFWRRWHVSLGAFFREYVYIPLGGNRVGKLKWCRNLLIVWALTGFWHGASWNFVVWGLYYGVLLMLEKIFFLDIKKHIPKVFNIMMTLFLVIIGWVFFYFEKLSDGVTHIGKMFGAGKIPLTDATTVFQFKNKFGFVLLALIACLPWNEWLGKMKRNGKFAAVWNVVSPVAALGLLLISVMLLVGQSFNPFLYFRF